MVTHRKQAIAALSGLAIFGLIGLQFTNESTTISTTEHVRAARRQLAALANGERRNRRLSSNGPSPPLEDIADASYIVKPSIGASFSEVFETMDQTTLAPPDAFASTQHSYLPAGSALDVLDGSTSTSWHSSAIVTGPFGRSPEWLQVDLGIPEEVAKVQIDFQQAAESGIDFELQCSDTLAIEWRTLDTRTGLTGTSVTFDQFVSPDNYCRYLRFYFTSGYTTTWNGEVLSDSVESGGSRVMRGGDILYPGQYIESANGLYSLRYALDGNLILSDAPISPNNFPNAYWTSNTHNTGKPAGHFIMQYNGNLAIKASDGSIVWQTGTGGNSGATFRLQNDGYLVLAAYNHGRLWLLDSDGYNARKLSKVENNTATSGTRRLSSREDRHLKTTIQDDQDRRLYYANYNHATATGPYYGVSFVKVWRMPRVASTTTTTNSCGADYSSVKSTLLSRNSHGGVLQEFLNAEFFSVSMTAAQADAMRDDPCSYAVEPNYIIRARGTKKLRAPARNEKPQGTTILKGQEPSQAQRRLGVPEFNLKDSNPGNWGLERISTRGVRNGKYIWVSEGFGTDVYVFDTGIHDSHEFTGRNITWGVIGPSRIEPAQICAGNAGDEGEHGSFIASIIGGKKYGVARMAAIHPMQILDINGEGSVATFLCGMDKVIQDGIDYYAANAPKKIKAVVNLSVGTNGKSDILDKAAEELNALGYTVVVAAGDYAGNSCHYSPSTPDAIRVGALKDAGLHGTPGAGGFNEKTDTSNFGQCIDIWAPGEDIVGANEEDFGTVTMSGTSVAAAFVSGTITQFLEEILSSETPQEMFPFRAKDKMLARSERDALGDVGVYGTDRVLQTTSSPCLSNIHCIAPKVCLHDGACGIMSDYF